MRRNKIQLCLAYDTFSSYGSQFTLTVHDVQPNILDISALASLDFKMLNDRKNPAHIPRNPVLLAMNSSAASLLGVSLNGPLMVVKYAPGAHKTNNKIAKMGAMVS
uniref:Uncharacterized protein n=1 Tax=Tetraselmis sp. GSL018 TaxID=582737 RepID=A0A061SH57_9CHLO